MAEITSGYLNKCDAPAGTEIVYAIPLFTEAGVTNVDTFTFLDGNVVAFTLKTGKQGFQFTIEAETANLKADSIGEKAAGSHAHSHASTFIFEGNTSEDIVRCNNLARGRHAIIHKLADDSFELLHMTNGAKGQKSRDGGIAYVDLNGTTMTMTSNEKESELKIDAAIVATLLLPAP